MLYKGIQHFRKQNILNDSCMLSTILIIIWTLTQLSLLQSQKDSHAIIFILPTTKLALQELIRLSIVSVAEIKIHHSYHPLRRAKWTDSLICHSLDLPLCCHPGHASPSFSQEKGKHSGNINAGPFLEDRTETERLRNALLT